MGGLMLKLQVLGSVDLLDAGHDVAPLLRRPKSVALLAYLAAARPRGFHRRDSLLALFWPELDEPHARNALRQTVHALRQVVGADTLIGRGEEELGVERSQLWCDVAQFEQDLDAGDMRSAIVLYRGELLHGFHVSGANDFDHWLDQERRYVAKRALTATLHLSKDEEKAGDYVTALTWAQRASEIDPYDESALRRLLRLLDRIGRRADAVRQYENFADRLALDLEITPSPETRSLMETIRARVEPQVFVSAGTLLPAGPAEPAGPGGSGGRKGLDGADEDRKRAADGAGQTPRRPSAVRTVLARSLDAWHAVVARVSAAVRSIQPTKHTPSSGAGPGSSSGGT